jgi:hypothetical protein
MTFHQIAAQVTTCAAACAKALGAVPLDSVTLDTVRALYAQPPALQEQLGGLAQLCTQRLMAEYGDVPATLSSGERLDQLGTLPVAAVVAFVESDDLRMTSENDVLVRGRWSAGREGERKERAGVAADNKGSTEREPCICGREVFFQPQASSLHPLCIYHSSLSSFVCHHHPPPLARRRCCARTWTPSPRATAAPAPSSCGS